MKVQFLGATRQVTGSSYLPEAGGIRVLSDCGLHQERAQELMYYLRELVAEDRVPHLPAFLDSPKGTPQHVFITHGEEEGAKCHARGIRKRWGCAVDVPAYRSEFDLA